jgi:hypothetical protein
MGTARCSHERTSPHQVVCVSGMVGLPPVVGMTGLTIALMSRVETPPMTPRAASTHRRSGRTSVSAAEPLTTASNLSPPATVGGPLR